MAESLKSLKLTLRQFVPLLQIPLSMIIITFEYNLNYDDDDAVNDFASV